MRQTNNKEEMIKISIPDSTISTNKYMVDSNCHTLYIFLVSTFFLMGAVLLNK